MAKTELAMNDGDDYDLLTSVAELLHSAIENKGFELPIFSAWVATDGSNVVFRYDKTNEGFVTTTLSDYGEWKGLDLLPLNVMFVDSQGKAVLAIVEKGKARLKLVHQHREAVEQTAPEGGPSP